MDQNFAGTVMVFPCHTQYNRQSLSASWRYNTWSSCVKMKSCHWKTVRTGSAQPSLCLLCSVHHGKKAWSLSPKVGFIAAATHSFYLLSGIRYQGGGKHTVYDTFGLPFECTKTVALWKGSDKQEFIVVDHGPWAMKVLVCNERWFFTRVDTQMGGLVYCDLWKIGVCCRFSAGEMCPQVVTQPISLVWKSPETKLCGITWV